MAVFDYIVTETQLHHLTSKEKARDALSPFSFGWRESAFVLPTGVARAWPPPPPQSSAVRQPDLIPRMRTSGEGCALKRGILLLGLAQVQCLE